MRRGKELKRQRKLDLEIMHLGINASTRLFTIFCLLFALICLPVSAIDLDTSIDDSIRKNYNPDKLEKDMSLPSLPKVLNEKNNFPIQKPIESQESGLTSIQKNQINSLNQDPLASHDAQQYCAVLRKGTRIKVKSLTNISDRSKKGSRVSFISIYPVSTTYLTIPSGTVLKGEIVKTHGPQLSANGGLIILNINSMKLSNETHPICASVTKANSKLVFFNKIKGERKYLQSMIKSTKNGRHFFGKMMKVSGLLASDGSSIVIAPFSLCAGIVTLGLNILAAPTFALFHKGGPISINAGSEFELKLNQNVYIYN